MYPENSIIPKVVWLTGLSGAGKTTLGEKLTDELRKKNLKVEFLDGDVLRNLFPATGFSRAERDEHVKRVGFLASRLEKNGVFVIAALISPYRETRDFVRTLCNQFVEVHAAASLEECERRDVKGLYAKARRGEIANFTGISDPYEEPLDPEIRVDTQHLSVDESVARILREII